MPLARILTFLPEEATPLSQQLQRLGFEVEVANPNQEQFAPADLEIEFAICDQQQVLARAGAIAAQLRAEVVVFPGAIPPLPEPTPMVAEVPVSAPEPRAILDQRQEHELRHGEREFDLSPLAAGTWFTRAGEKLSKMGRQAASGCSKLSQGVLSGIERLSRVIGSGLSKLKTGVFGAAGSIAERTRGYQERINVRAAELERRRAETLGRETGKAERAGATHQQQLETAQAEREKRLAKMDRLRAEAREQVAALERARLAAEAEQRRLQQYFVPPAERPRPRRPPASQLRGVFTGVVAASLLFIVGMLLANFHPSTPLPVNVTNSSTEQQTPFGATTVRGTPGVTLGGAKSPRPAPAIKSAQPLPAPAQLAKPQPSPSSPPAVKQKSPWHRFRQTSKTGEDSVTADDVVVRHFPSQQRPIGRNTQQQAGLKHYSDQ